MAAETRKPIRFYFDFISPFGYFASLAGVDPDFGKGSTEVSRFNGDPAHHPNPCLGPIATPPFCALKIWPADAASSTGLATNADGVVLDGAGAPIPGLYACGNDMASVMRGAHPGPGTTIGPAMVFGYRIGVHAKALSESTPTAMQQGRRDTKGTCPDALWHLAR